MTNRAKYLLLAGWYVGFSIFFFAGCNPDDDDNDFGNWIRRSDFEGDNRSGAVAFANSTKAYVGTGYDGDDYLSDFWEYDPDRNFWVQKASFPGKPRNGAVAFGIGDKGYVGTGFDGDDYLADFWEYDMTANQWRQIATFPGTPRRSAVAFSLLNKGYLTTGYGGSDYKDCWRYEPATDQWTQVPSFGGSKTSGAFAFVLYDKAYVGGGRNNGLYVEDFWEFDPVAEQWREREELDTDDWDVTVEFPAAFGLNGKGYVASGLKSFNIKTVWEYDPALDEWDEMAEFEGVSRQEAVSFVINGRAFVTTGRTAGQRFDDIWEFRPDQEWDEDD